MTTARKLTFVHTQNRFFADTQMFGIHFMPVWAYTLAAHVATIPEVEVALFDERFEKVVDVGPADVFLFTGINQDYDAIVATRRTLKARFPNACFVIGGPIVWSLNTAGKIGRLDMFDHLFIGDGEETVVEFVRALQSGAAIPKVIQAPRRFDLRQALPMHRHLLQQTIARYYGAVIEVSRGCPFLCEFCDIRILPDNNRAHVKDPARIVGEIDTLHDLGVRQVLFACDNLIGDHRWAEELCDQILGWQQRTGKRVSLYTWLTVNLARHPILLQKLRRAGFDLFFIGVESFSQSSLLETAKVQNNASQLVRALRTIQSHGFIVVAGLIMGFDTDPDDVTARTLKGLLDSGLISGDPSLLTALPGTPLYERMRLSKRLREEAEFGLGGFKYQTNIKYLKPAERIRADFQTFVREFNRGPYQYKRLLSFYDCMDGDTYLPPQTAGYADMRRLALMTLRNGRAIYLLWLRLFRLLRSPERCWHIARAFLHTWRRTSPDHPLWFHFKFWLFNWSNSITKYAQLSDADFDVASVETGFAIDQVLPAPYEAWRQEQIPDTKIRAQRRLTAQTLRRFVRARMQTA